MDNDILKQLNEFQNVTQNLYASLVGTLAQMKDTLPEEQRKELEATLKSVDVEGTLKEITSKTKELRELQSKLNGYNS